MIKLGTKVLIKGHSAVGVIVAATLDGIYSIKWSDEHYAMYGWTEANLRNNYQLEEAEELSQYQSAVFKWLER